MRKIEDYLNAVSRIGKMPEAEEIFICTLEVVFHRNPIFTSAREPNILNVVRFMQAREKSINIGGAFYDYACEHHPNHPSMIDEVPRWINLLDAIFDGVDVTVWEILEDKNKNGKFVITLCMSAQGKSMEQIREMLDEDRLSGWIEKKASFLTVKADKAGECPSGQMLGHYGYEVVEIITQ